jgi:hypothetical protein
MKRTILPFLALLLVAAWAAAGCGGQKAGTGSAGEAAPPLSAHDAGAPPAPAGDTGSATAPAPDMANPHAGMSGMNPHAGMSGMPGGAPAIEAQTGGAPDAAAGLKWSVPAKWKVLPERPMRVATYGLPGAGGGECAVFYFGPGQGGGAEANIQRWTGQFEAGAASKRSARDVGGLKVSLVEISGTYLAPGGPMMQSQGSLPGYQLLGAIVEGPQGSVFFKLTGPAQTVKGARGDFDALVASLVRQ